MVKKQAKIGLEIHSYLQTKEKLFCRCKAVRHASKQQLKPNTFICPICTGQPGCKLMLPNSEAIKKTTQISLMLNCRINTSPKPNQRKVDKKTRGVLMFNRKHYDWPDLPKGYQDTVSGAYSVPFGQDGKFENIRISEVHLEEDPASWNPETGCIDYNRSGLPLAEIVTEPDFSSSEQVEIWLKKLLLTLSYIKAVDKNAGIKADVNVSLAGGERVEIKNLSSIQSIKKAIEYEIDRQHKERAVRETRRYDEAKGKTISMRTKELAADYRFIPDPDLPVLQLTEPEVKQIRENLPESPQNKLNKLIKKHKISRKDAEVLYKNLELVEFFEKIAEKISPEFALSWVTVELLRVLNYNKKTLDSPEISIKPEHFIELLKAVKSDKITELKAKQILNDFIPKSFSIKEKLKSESKISSKSEIEKICRNVLNKNKKAVQDYKSGEEKALNFLIGQVMRESRKRADFKTAKEILVKLIS